MNIIRRVKALLLAGALALGLSVPALAAEYTDLSGSHWAYEDMTKAAGLGIIQGVGEGRMAPGDTMSWGQFLAMLTRTFAPDAYAEASAAGLAWDQAGYAAAEAAGLLRAEDGLPVTAEDLSGPIARQDAAVLLWRALPEDAADFYYVWEGNRTNPASLTDWTSMDELHQGAVAALADLALIHGKGDGSFGYADSIQRCDGTVLVMRVLDVVDSCLRSTAKTVTLRFVDAETGQAILPDQTAQAQVGQSLYSLPQQYDIAGLEHYEYLWYGSPVTEISSACGAYTLYYRPLTAAEIAQNDFLELVQQGQATFEEYMQQDFWLDFQGENERKLTLLFGDPSRRRFSSQEEAEASMTTVTVPVWKLSGGQKVSSTMSFSIHAALAQDVTEIFTEIYNDPEQFPIKDLGGYSWRGDTATGEHNCGTAIDINANENYQIREGQILTGTCWEPETNPYSIGPDSSVVRIFAEHGWSWGGDAWAASSDDSSGYHDYMHFSYLGE